MLFMVTNRRIIDGQYGDEERPNKKFEYQYSYNNKKEEMISLKRQEKEVLKLLYWESLKD